MIDSKHFSCTSPLISEELEGQLRPVFEKLTETITFVSIVDDNNEKCTELAIFLNHLACLSPRLECFFYTLEEYRATGGPLACDMLPVVGFFKGDDFCRIAFHGVPGGKEINAFVMAILHASACAQAPEAAFIEKLQKFTKPTEILICVSLNCQHCTNVVVTCQQMALLNEHISASMIDANLFPALVTEYSIERVPMIIINKKHTLMGNKTSEQVLEFLNTMV